MMFRFLIDKHDTHTQKQQQDKMYLMLSIKLNLLIQCLHASVFLISLRGIVVNC